jgi:iduronate 2-sulfatase
MRLLTCVLALLAALGSAAPAAAAAKKLNVLFIMSDDLRPELGCYGHKLIKTPNIDKLAAAAVRFERAYCQFPLCNPSRTSLLTGRHPTTTGVLDNVTWFGALHPDWVSLPRLFQMMGYATLRTGKIFHGGIDDADAWTEGGEKRNFEGAINDKRVKQNVQNSDRQVVLDGDGEAHADFKTAERAMDYLRRHKDRPFFLACGFTRPHSPMIAPRKLFERYDPAQVTLPPDFATKPTVPPGFPKLSVPARNGDLFVEREASPELARDMIRAYWASATWVDWNVGRVLDELDRLGLRENTIIIFWGDHGYHLGEKGKWSKHGSLFEIGTRVPLLVAAPGAPGNGKSSPRPVQALDLYPTLCELCGLKQPAGLQGHSLAPLLRDPGAAWEHAAYSVFGRADRLVGVAVRTERFRYVEYDGGEGGAMLFEHPADSYEQRNLAEDRRFAAVRAELSALVRRHAAGFKPAVK